jgi:hypothetical protein
MECTHCKKDIESDALFCSHCGKSQGKEKEKNPLTENLSKSTIVVSLIFAVLIMVGSKACVDAIFSPAPEASKNTPNTNQEIGKLSSKCELIGQFAAAMVEERDRGVTKKQALNKLKKGGSSNEDCIEVINSIWSKDLKQLSAEGAYSSFSIACESTEGRK